ncbi:hypothetical protein JN01_0640 [Entomoplasma freundtii]|uniref:Uncharacterized protein n=1 Tax=Entomoplasma freundtii TaxID=74700 RepID=A0A2K8NR52_9MOLU|nr:hypothetical protein [Entomoplasma freundtii]ATZ16320.1 hypothetical protein EFREU_v1c02940 [Entomoplasma freundtii]TDY56641.1 hypothetical protein JN01_0640 [Entomoplasma freundtii]
MNKPSCSLLESSLFMGGVKVKLDGKTCAQFPKLDLAISYCQKMLAKDKEFYKVIDYVRNDATTEKITLFED